VIQNSGEKFLVAAAFENAEIRAKETKFFSQKFHEERENFINNKIQHPK
jgi:hypothetical protein